MNLEVVKSDHSDLINLAEAISKFKTKEMEVAFAEFLKKAINPPMFLKE